MSNKKTQNEKQEIAAQELEALRAELEAMRAELAAEAAEKVALSAALEAEKAKKANRRKEARPPHVEFLTSPAARAVLAIATTGKAATAALPAYLATTLLSKASHATGAARQVTLLVSRGLSYTGGVLPNLLPPAITERLDALKEDIKIVSGWIELVGLRDDYNIIPKEYLQAIADAPDTKHHIYVRLLNDLRLKALAVQKKAFTEEDYQKIEAGSREVYPWNFESWGVSTEAGE